MPIDPNNPQAGPVEASPHAGAQGNPSIQQFIDELNQLRQTLEPTVESLAKARQEQANKIDVEKGLSNQYVKETARLAKLSAHLKELTDRQKTLDKASGEYAEITRQIEASQSAVRQYQSTLSAIGADMSGLSKALHDLHGRVRELDEASTKASANVKAMDDILLRRPRAVGAGLAEKAPAAADIARYMGASAPALVEKLLPFTKALGGFMLAVDAAFEVARAATRQSTTYADVYSGDMGMATKAQAEFIAGIPMWASAMYGVAEVQRIGAAAQKAGAMDYYSAQDGINRRLAEMSASMAAYGKSIGLTEEESGRALASMITTMGAFGGSLKPTDTELRRVQNTLGGVSRAVGLRFSEASDMIAKMGETTMPAGVAFKTLAIQVAGSASALKSYAKTLQGTDNAFLASSAAVKRTLESLFQYGTSISPTQAVGYGMVAGQVKPGTDIASAIMSAAGQSPFERIATQYAAFGKLKLSSDWQGVAMMNSGMPAALASQMARMAKTRPEDFKRLMGEFRASTDAADAERRVRALGASAPRDQQGMWDSIGSSIQMLQPPQEQMVSYLQTIAEKIRVLVQIASSPGGLIFGSRETMGPMARPVSPGNGSHFSTAAGVSGN